MLTRDVIEWSRLLLPDVHFEQGPDIPRYPGAMVLWTPNQGGGLQAEHALDTPVFQAHAIGSQSRNRPTADEAEELIYAVDRLICQDAWPQKVNGIYVVTAARFGSGPTPVQADNAGRGHFTCNYLFQCATDYSS